MYSRFQLSYKKFNQESFNSGLKLYNQQKANTHAALDRYLCKDGIINGSDLQNDWFPQVNADIFLSHSHADENLAITLAGIFSNLGLTVFIDSAIWGYSDNLLQEIDNKYCENSDKTTYNYKKRNKSTSYVHMMLATALNMMIDKTECLIFLNTPNSITPNEIVTQTNSPWLYAELATSKVVRRQDLTVYRKEVLKGQKSLTKLFSESFEMRFQVDLRHLIPLTELDLLQWQIGCLTIPGPDNSLDILYGLIEKKILNS